MTIRGRRDAQQQDGVAGGDEPNDVNQGHICSPAEDPDTALKKLAMGPPNSITSEKNIPQLPETETPGVDKAKIGSVGGGCQGEYHQEAKDSSVVECGGVEGKFAQLNLNPSGVMTTRCSPYLPFKLHPCQYL